MDKFLRSFITIERYIQLVALLGVMVFLGYLGFTSYQSHRTPSYPVIAPTTHQ
ncbi:MAG: hypothetical protein VKL59_25310 [Nostocaceae cyanobacterium]|nr:hypothetical protein [Nostocaceae cyanobacterium]